MMLEEARRKMIEKQRRFQKLWVVLSEKWPPPTRGKVVAFQPPHDVYERLCSVKDRHSMRSLKEAAYKAMLVGLRDLEGVPPVPEDFAE